MTCPHCQKELPENYSAMWCPFCEKNFYFDEPPPPKAFQINWLVFFAVLLAPPVFNLVGIVLGTGSLIFISTFVGSVVTGIICGGMLARRRAAGMETNMALAILFAALLGGFSFFLCFVGCVAAIPLMNR